MKALNTLRLEYPTLEDVKVTMLTSKPDEIYILFESKEDDVDICNIIFYLVKTGYSCDDLISVVESKKKYMLYFVKKNNK